MLSKELQKSLKKQGMKFFTGHKVTSVENNGNNMKSVYLSTLLEGQIFCVFWSVNRNFEPIEFENSYLTSDKNDVFLEKKTATFFIYWHT